jgi:hypothetical protein
MKDQKKYVLVPKTQIPSVVIVISVVSTTESKSGNKDKGEGNE